MRHLFFLAGLLAASPALAAPHDTLTVGLSQFPPDMHPYVVATNVKSYLLRTALRGIIYYDTSGQPHCQLCTELPTLANGAAKLVPQADGSTGMEVTFTLRPELSWGDGVPLTSADIVFSWRVAQAFAPNSDVTAVDVVDPHTVRIHRRAVRYNYAEQPFGPVTDIIPEHVEGPIFAAAHDPLDYASHSAFDRAPDTPGLWMGPYRVTAFHSNDSVTLEPNPHWTGHPPGFRRITMKLLENTSALEANLLSGDIDMISTELGLTIDQSIGLSRTQADRFDFAFVPTLAFEHLALQLDNKLLADVRVRQALMLAIDRATIVKRLFSGLQPVAETIVSPSEAEYDPTVRKWPYDPAAARKLLDAAGFHPGADGILVAPDGTRLSLEIITTAGNRQRELVEEVLQSEFRAIGVELTIQNQTARTMFGDTLRYRKFTGMVMYQRVPAPDQVPDTFLGTSGIPAQANNFTGTNYVGFSDPAMDAALRDAVGELDVTRRLADWKRIEAIANDQLPVLPLFFATKVFIQPKWMDGLLPARQQENSTNWVEYWHPRTE
jgi:peptide/nickel transport system substrate-binding protein